MQVHGLPSHGTKLALRDCVCWYQGFICVPQLEGLQKSAHGTAIRLDPVSTIRV